MEKLQKFLSRVLSLLPGSSPKPAVVVLPPQPDIAPVVDTAVAQVPDDYLKKFLLMKIVDVGFTRRAQTSLKNGRLIFAGNAKPIRFIYELASLRKEGIMGCYGMGPTGFALVNEILVRESVTEKVQEKLAIERERLLQLKCHEIPPLMESTSYKEFLKIIEAIDGDTVISWKVAAEFATGNHVFYDMFPHQWSLSRCAQSKYEIKIPRKSDQENVRRLINASQKIILDYYTNQLEEFVKKEIW